MDENTTTHIPADVVLPEEEAARADSAIQAKVAAVVQKVRRQSLERAIEAIGPVDDLDRGDVIEHEERRVAEPVAQLPESIRVLGPSLRHHYERTFKGEEARWRTVEGDHYIAEWIRARTLNDRAGMLEANAKVDLIFARALDVGATPGDGGFAGGSGAETVPRPLEQLVLINRDKLVKMPRFARNYVMTAKEHNIPTMAAVTSGMVLEGGAMSAANPIISQVPLQAEKAYAMVDVTRELLDDNAVNLVSSLASRAGASIAVTEDDQWFVSGDGTAPNIGSRISHPTPTAAPAGVADYAFIVALYFAVAQQYRAGGVWFAADDVAQLMTAAVDGQGRPLFQGLQERPLPVTDDDTAMGVVLGKPFYETVLPSGELMFGNIDAWYAIGRRAGLTTNVSEHVGFLNDVWTWKFTTRLAGNNVDAFAAGAQATGITSVTP